MKDHLTKRVPRRKSLTTMLLPLFQCEQQPLGCEDSEHPCAGRSVLASHMGSSSSPAPVLAQLPANVPCRAEDGSHVGDRKKLLASGFGLAQLCLFGPFEKETSS